MSNIVSATSDMGDKRVIENVGKTFQIDFGEQRERAVVWTIRYQSDTCDTTTTYTVRAASPIDPLKMWVDDGVGCFDENGNVGGYDKWYKEKELQSSDGGVTWVESGNIRPKSGGLIERNSTDCGYTPEVCEITSISCTPTSYTLTSATDSAETIVTVVGSRLCSKKWKAIVSSNEVIGNSGDPLKVGTPQTVTISSMEDVSKTCSFTVNQFNPSPSFSAYFEVGIDSNYGTHLTFQTSSQYCRQINTNRVEIAGNFTGIINLTLTVECSSLTSLGQTAMKYWVWDDHSSRSLVDRVDGMELDGANRFSKLIEGKMVYFSTIVYTKDENGVVNGRINVAYQLSECPPQ